VLSVPLCVSILFLFVIGILGEEKERNTEGHREHREERKNRNTEGHREHREEGGECAICVGFDLLPVGFV
jgi:hypothetical protein